MFTIDYDLEQIDHEFKKNKSMYENVDFRNHTAKQRWGHIASCKVHLH